MVSKTDSTDGKGAAPAVAPLEGHFDNTGFDWLTYETVGNKIRFRKSNQRRRLGFYVLNLDSMQVWVREHISPAALAVLTESFCPDSEPADISAISDSLWNWKQRVALNVRTTLALSPATSGPAHEQYLRTTKAEGSLPSEVPSSRDTIVLHRGAPRALMPFNYWDNDDRSEGLGTDATKPRIPAYDHTPVGPPRQLRCKPLNDWFLWRTASRSCVMQIGRVIERFAVLDECEHPTTEWQEWPWKTVGPEWKDKESQAAFSTGAYRLPAGPWQTEREYFENARDRTEADRYRYVNAAFAEDIAGTDHFQLSSMTGNHFSVKTGVCWVGFSDQKFAHKDIIGDWIVGSLRSDYVAEVDHGPLNASGWERHQDILCQTELFAIIEKPSGRCDNSLMHGQDGVAVRDLSPLQRDRVYLPPLSIPMLGRNNHELAEEFSLVRDEAWCAFWRENYAEALGRAKALLLLRYGLQHGNPNVQNYLLEFKKGDGALVGPSRVLIRDLQDAALHREVIWALYGPGGAPPAADRNSGDLESAYTELAKLKLECLKYQFAEFKERDLRAEETGSTNAMFGPPGTQLGWFRFSTFFSAEKLPKDLRQDAWFPILSRMLEWGYAHACTFVRTVEECLGVNLWDVAWAAVPGPERYESTSADALRTTFRKGTYVPAHSPDGALQVSDFQQTSASAAKIRDLMLAGEPEGTTPLGDEYTRRLQVVDEELFGTRLASDSVRQGRISRYDYENGPIELVKNPGSGIHVDGFNEFVAGAQEFLVRLVLNGEQSANIAAAMNTSPPATPNRPPTPTAGSTGGPPTPGGRGGPPFPGGARAPMSRADRAQAWVAAIESWRTTDVGFKAAFESLTAARDRIIQEATGHAKATASASTFWGAIKFLHWQRYLDTYEKLDEENGLKGWDKWIAIKLSGSGFSARSTVQVVGYACRSVFYENPSSLYCAFEHSDGLSDDARSSALTVTLTEGRDSVTLQPRLEGDLPWEESIAAVVHRLLRSEAGQNAIRGYRDRKWEPMPARFRIRVVDWDRAPLVHKFVLICMPSRTCRIPTDRNGEIPFWDDEPPEIYSFPELRLLEGNTYQERRRLQLRWSGRTAVLGSTRYSTTANANLVYTIFREGREEERRVDVHGMDVIEDAVPGMQVQVKSHGGLPVALCPGETVHVAGDADRFGGGIGFDVYCEFI